jgi:hypothetical protein
MQDTVGPDLQSRADPLDDLGVRASGFFFLRSGGRFFIDSHGFFWGGWLWAFRPSVSLSFFLYLRAASGAASALVIGAL